MAVRKWAGFSGASDLSGEVLAGRAARGELLAGCGLNASVGWSG
jgi:hypothetical protein